MSHALLLGVLFLAPVGDRAEPVPEPPAPLFRSIAAAPPGPDAKRSRTVALEDSLLATPAGSSEAVCNRLLLNLFDGVELEAVYSATIPAHGGGFLQVYSLEGGGSAVFSIVEDAVTATIRTAETLYHLHPAGEGVHVVFEKGPGPGPGCDRLLRTSPGSSGTSGAAAEAAGPSAGGSADFHLDLLVAYTADAAAANGGKSGMTSLINLAVYETNLGFAQSDVLPRVDVVHVAEVGLAETGDEQDLIIALQDPTDGLADEVHALRTEYGADLVGLIYDTGTMAGISYDQLCSLDPAFESSAFFAVQDVEAAGSYELAHHIGHLLGADHAISDNNYYCQIDPACFGRKTSSYRTIMALDSGIRLPFWSNPNKADPLGEALGVAGSEENWRTLNQSAATAAAWRTARDPGHELTTTFQSDFDIRGNMFDVTPAVDLEIVGLDVNATNFFTTVRVSVWYRIGSHQGHEDSSTGWLLLGSGTGLSLGRDLPTFIDIDSSAFLHAGQTYGLFVELTSGTQALRTTSGAPAQYRNQHLSLVTGPGKSGDFTSTTTPDRQWNGTLHYEPASGTGSLATTFAGALEPGGSMFEVTTRTAITLNGIDVNVDDSAAPGLACVDVWYRNGSFAGHESDPAAWTYLGSDDRAQGAGAGSPTRVCTGSLALAAGSTYSFYVHLGSFDLGHRLRASAGTSTFENADLRIHPGISKGEYAFGPLNVAQRLWNGTLHYTPAPWQDLGHGLPGPVYTPVLAASGSLLPGSALKLTLTGGPPRAPALVIIGFSTWYAPFLNGTMVPSLDLHFTVPLDGRGDLVLSGGWPLDLPQGTPVYFQYWIPDGKQYLASNAIQVTAQ